MPRTKGEAAKPLIFGEAPSKSGDKYHMFPLSGAVAETLCKLAGIAPEIDGSRYGRWTWALYDHFECENLIERWPGRQGTGSAFPMDVAKVHAETKLLEARGRVVVLLGARLPKAFGIDMPFYSWRFVCPAEDFDVDVHVPDIVHRPTGWTKIVSIPHPSGLNRMLNDPAERERCGVVLREAMQIARRVEFA